MLLQPPEPCDWEGMGQTEAAVEPMRCDPVLTDRINSFALVSYIPGRLGDFITRLREDLVQGCVARSHVTILPPRPLHVDTNTATEQVRSGLAPFNAFELDMPRIRVFEQTAVVFCEIGKGPGRTVRSARSDESGRLVLRRAVRFPSACHARARDYGRKRCRRFTSEQ